MFAKLTNSLINQSWEQCLRSIFQKTHHHFLKYYVRKKHVIHDSNQDLTPAANPTAPQILTPSLRWFGCAVVGHTPCINLTFCYPLCTLVGKHKLPPVPCYLLIKTKKQWLVRIPCVLLIVHEWGYPLGLNWVKNVGVQIAHHPNVFIFFCH